MALVSLCCRKPFFVLMVHCKEGIDGQDRDDHQDHCTHLFLLVVAADPVSYRRNTLRICVDICIATGLSVYGCCATQCAYSRISDPDYSTSGILQHTCGV